MRLLLTVSGVNFLMELNKLKEKISQDIENLSVSVKNTQQAGVINSLHFYILSLEDRRFFRHCGVDFWAVLREIWKAIRGKKHGGASTINMQLVRTITHYREPNLKRKLYEILLAVIIDYRFKKINILNCYIENAYLGTGIIGFQRASQTRYDKDLQYLTSYEKASLAAMLLYPMPRSPTEKWLSANKQRAFYALKYGLRIT